MNEQIQIAYQDFLISYREHENIWVPKRNSGELPGCTSLAKAKEAIDNLSKQEKSKFIRHKAIFMANAYTDPVLVEVTSFITKPGRAQSSLYAWIKLPDGHRRCEYVETLREFTDENQDTLFEINQIKKDVEVIRSRMQVRRSALTLYILKPAKQTYSSDGIPADVAALLPK